MRRRELGIEGARDRGRRGFTLIELLVVVGIVALLLAISVPSLANARKQAKRVVCLSNQKQIALAMHSYTNDNGDRFPIAQYFDMPRAAWVAWDTTSFTTASGGVQPGLIWRYADGRQVQQCPSYRGPSMTAGDEYTGYNYNTTYIGRGQGEGAFQGMDESPALATEIRRPAGTVITGDGGYASGANKFMRAPLDGGVSESLVHAGTQAYRHANATNVTFVDGHGEPTARRFRKPGASPSAERLMAFPKNGFLTADDRIYSRH